MFLFLLKFWEIPISDHENEHVFIKRLKLWISKTLYTQTFVFFCFNTTEAQERETLSPKAVITGIREEEETEAVIFSPLLLIVFLLMFAILLLKSPEIKALHLKLTFY